MLLRREPGHVLHQAEDRPVDGRILEHVHALFHVREGDRLGRRDDDGAFHRNVIHQGDVDVAGARGQVDEQVVQRAPLDLQDHLLEGAAGHRPAPDERLAGLGEIPDGHPLDPILLDRDEEFLALLLTGFSFRLQVFRAGHDGHGRPIDIGVGETDPVSQARQRDGEIHRNGGLAHAALAGGHRNDVRDLVHLVQAQVQRRLLRRRRLLYNRLHLHLGTSRGIAVHRRPDGPDKVILQRVRPFPESQRHRHLPPFHRHLLDHAEGNDILVIPSGMLYLGKPVKYFFFGHLPEVKVYFAKSSSAMMLEAPPSFSTRKRT